MLSGARMVGLASVTKEVQDKMYRLYVAMLNPSKPAAAAETVYVGPPLDRPFTATATCVVCGSQFERSYETKKAALCATEALRYCNVCKR